MKVLPTFLLSTSLLPALDFRLEPTFHFNGVIGETSGHSFQEIGGHAHDPNNNFAVQGLEPGMNIYLDDWLAGFTNVNIFTDSDHQVDWELEEAFLKFQNLPGGFEIRGGRMLNRVGLQNNQHLHAWNLVNSNLTTSQFLGEEGLLTEGAELTWRHDFDQGFFAISTNFGNASSHHHHGGEDHDDDHEDEEHEDEHDDHSGSAEDAFMQDNVITNRILIGYNHTDFHQHRIGLNSSWGTNGYERDTSLQSIDYVYTWRENGLQPRGRSLSLGAELSYRDVEWQSEEDATITGASSQLSWMAFASYRFHPQWIADIRYENQEGARGGADLHDGVLEYAFQSHSRERISLALTREFGTSPTNLSTIRLQYSHDNLDGEKADSIFLQFGFDFGAQEVR